MYIVFSVKSHFQGTLTLKVRVHWRTFRPTYGLFLARNSNLFGLQHMFPTFFCLPHILTIFFFLFTTNNPPPTSTTKIWHYSSIYLNHIIKLDHINQFPDHTNLKLARWKTICWAANTSMYTHLKIYHSFKVCEKDDHSLNCPSPVPFL